MLFLLCVPFSNFTYIFGNFSLLEAVIVAYLLFAIFCSKSPFFISRFQLFGLFLILLMLFLIISLFGLRVDYLVYFTQLLFAVILLPLFSSHLCRRISIETLLKSCLIIAVCTSVVLILSPYIANPLVRFDGRARYFPNTTGSTATFLIAFSYVAFLFSKHKINIIAFAFLTVVLVSGVLMISQRSTLLGFVLVLSMIFLKGRTAGLIAILLLSAFIVLGVGMSFLEGARVSEDFLEDASRLTIISDLITSISLEPENVLYGWGPGNWESSIASQKPHNNFLHLMIDYGVIIAVYFSIAVFGFAFYFLLPKECSNRKLYFFLFLATIPYYATHTYTLERGKLIFFVMMSCFFVSDLRDAKQHSERGLN